MNADLAILAGGISTVIFACSVMPMILKAVRTRDLASYSLTNLRRIAEEVHGPSDAALIPGY